LLLPLRDTARPTLIGMLSLRKQNNPALLTPVWNM
jgi:hypothetical protein